MDQIKLVIHGASDKVTGIANDTNKKVVIVTNVKKKVTKVNDTTPSDPTSDSLPSTCSSLSKKQRLNGFITCFVLGFFVSLGVIISIIFESGRSQSTVALIVGSDNGTKFGVTYSLGNIISLCGYTMDYMGHGFLVGPKQQVELMFKPVRCIATIIYLVMIVVQLWSVKCFCLEVFPWILTILSACVFQTPQLGLVVLLLVLIQSTAAVWYSASYIPYGRKILARIAKKVCGMAIITLDDDDGPAGYHDMDT
ncbi:hypothetical protein KXD40_008761 [Peronospora effusa]|nr:hypothetical protein KXD40_008761 [Peronospora effusa]